jgi:HSP20 family protein
MAVKNLIPKEKKELPIKRGIYDPFTAFRQEMNRLFSNFFKTFDIEPFETRFGTFSPSVNVVEGDKEIKVSAELPGMDEKDIEVSLTKNVLTIKGEKKEEKEDKGKNYYKMERSYGAFSRTIPLPVEIDIDKAKAQFKKGVLTITLPKSPKAIKETKKIPVKSE